MPIISKIGVGWEVSHGDHADDSLKFERSAMLQDGSVGSQQAICCAHREEVAAPLEQARRRQEVRQHPVSQTQSELT